MIPWLSRHRASDVLLKKIDVKEIHERNMMQYTKYTYIILHAYVISSGYSYLNLHQPTIVNISKHHEPYGYVSIYNKHHWFGGNLEAKGARAPHTLDRGTKAPLGNGVDVLNCWVIQAMKMMWWGLPATFHVLWLSGRSIWENAVVWKDGEEKKIPAPVQLRCHFLVFYFILYGHISIAFFNCFVSSSPFERGPGSANTMGHCEDVLTKANEPFDIWRDEHLPWVPWK